MTHWLFCFASVLVIPLSPERKGAPEQIVNRGSLSQPDRSVSGVTEATLSVFLPESETAAGKGILVCPGGGYSHLAIDKEGLEVADWLNRIGVAAFVLKYRLPLALDAKARLPLDNPEVSSQFAALPIEDARAALRVIRARAAEFHLRPGHLGMMGFSAGGHLTAMVGALGIGTEKPDFLALIYPAVPLHFIASPETPPTFIAQADDDRSAPVANTVRFYLALREAHVPTELHIYASGGHAFGVRRHGTASDAWMAAFEAWLRSH